MLLVWVFLKILHCRILLKFQHESNIWVIMCRICLLTDEPKCVILQTDISVLTSDPESWCKHAVYCTVLCQIKLGIIRFCEIIAIKTIKYAICNAQLHRGSLHFFNTLSFAVCFPGASSFPGAVKFQEKTLQAGGINLAFVFSFLWNPTVNKHTQ